MRADKEMGRVWRDKLKAERARGDKLRDEAERLRNVMHHIASGLRLMSCSPLGGPHSQQLAEKAERLAALTWEHMAGRFQKGDGVDA